MQDLGYAVGDLLTSGIDAAAGTDLSEKLTEVYEENKKNPLTDNILSAKMKEKGYIVARRTVAKYREQLEIPVARLRKEL